MMNYLKSFFNENKKEEYTWISCLILFSDNKKLILDKGFVITGEIADYPFYCQFNNFTIINGELHYIYPEGFKKIDPKKVYLHLRFGNSPYEIIVDNLMYWNLYFTNPNNKIFKSFDLDVSKIKIIQNEKNETLNIKDIKHPFFCNKQIYDNNSVLFSHIKLI